MRRSVSTLAFPILLAVCFVTIGLFVISFIKPLGVSKDWVDDYQNKSSVYRKGIYWGAAGQGGRIILLSNGVVFDHTYAFGDPYVDRKTLVRHEHKWHPDAAGKVSGTTLGFSWFELHWLSGGYSYERQVSVPLLFIAFVAGLFPLMNLISRRRRTGKGFPVEIPQDSVHR